MRRVEFTLPYALPLLNFALRQHWAKRTKERRVLAWFIAAELGPDRPSFERARVTVVRYSPGAGDPDNLPSCAKNLLDVLKAFHATRNPIGLGVIRDDSPRHIDLTVTQQKCKRNETRTVVTVEELT